MDSIGKRILHAFFGIILGAGLGYLGAARLFGKNYLEGALIGAVIGGIAAFFLTDRFWESLGN